MPIYFRGLVLAIVLFAGVYAAVKFGAPIRFKEAIASWSSGDRPDANGARAGPKARTGDGSPAAERTVLALLTPDQPIPVTAAYAQIERLPIIRTSVGWIESMATVRVRARVEGEITERLVEDGAVVAAGDVLFRVDDSELRAQIAREEATLARERAMLARAEEDHVRARELWSRNVTSQAKLDQIASEVKVSAANVAASEAMLQTTRIKFGYTTVRAPIAGRVGFVKAVKGGLVGPSDGANGLLLTITQVNPLQVSFSLPERDLDVIRGALKKASRTLRVQVFADRSDRPVGSGTLSAIDSTVDTTSGTILIKAVIANDDEALWPGQYVRAEMDQGQGPALITVPLAAVQPEQRRSSVFVLEAGGTVARREVDVVQIAGNRAALGGAVLPGDRVVVEGLFRLRDGARVTVSPVEAPRRTAEGNGYGLR
jgi:multidrug efflux system membrane fusion protein